MCKTITRTIDNFHATFQLEQSVITLSLKSFDLMLVLFAHYSKDNMPPALLNIMQTPEHFFEVL